MSIKLVKNIKSDMSGLRKLPIKIHRTSTDILNALSATVGHDTTGTEYKFVDDPYLIPTTIPEKRVYALAQESGKKAAKWIHKEHAELFQHLSAQPPIAAYIPAINESVDEPTIRKYIKNQDYSTALSLYNELAEKTADISSDLKREILEIACFSNEETIQPTEFNEERWFQQPTFDVNRFRKTWNNGGLAEKLFAELNPKDAHLYNSMIRGKCKFFDMEPAYSMYSDALDKKIPIDVNTHNAFIRIAGHLTNNNSQKWESAVNVLETMSKNCLKPNLGTLNAVLYLISTIGNTKLAKQYVLQTLAEFNTIGIRPTLESWDIILQIFCKNRGPVSYCLTDVLDILETGEILVADKNDTKFFLNAMNICRNHLNDSQLARRVDRLAQENVNLLGDARSEMIYYRNYFGVLLANEMPETFMETYDKLVPATIIPDIGSMVEIVNFIRQHSAMHLVGRIWTDVVQFDYVYRKDIGKSIVKLMAENYNSVEDVVLQKTFAQITMEMFIGLQLELTKAIEMEYDGELFGDLLLLFCYQSDLSAAIDVFALIKKHAHELQGLPSLESIENYLKICLENGQNQRVTECLNCCVKSLFADVMNLDNILPNFKTLTEEQVSQLKSLSQNVVKS